uniref:hypothetical protein RF2 n=1 Tax=Hydnora esculenta TaxID=1851369 RepID=UPI0021149EAC|nr:hypothetical protein RF2 [Hydnora esculenta]USN93633.1 hypothetical protein RF2 [Hydnora esculenta]
MKKILNEIKEVLRELKIYKNFISISTNKIVKFLNSIEFKNIFIIILMYLSVFICVNREYAYKHVNQIRNLLLPLKIKKIDTNYKSIISKEEELNRINREEQIKRINEFFQKEDFSKKFINEISYNIEKNKIKFPIEIKLDKKIYDCRTDFVEPKCFSYDVERGLTNVHRGVYIGINLAHDIWGWIDYYQSYFFIAVTDNKTYFTLKFGVLYDLIKEKLTEKKRKKNSFSSISTRFLDIYIDRTNNNCFYNVIEEYSKYRQNISTITKNFYIKWSEILLNFSLPLTIETKITNSFSGYKNNLFNKLSFFKFKYKKKIKLNNNNLNQFIEQFNYIVLFLTNTTNFISKKELKFSFNLNIINDIYYIKDEIYHIKDEIYHIKMYYYKNKDYIYYKCLNFIDDIFYIKKKIILYYKKKISYFKNRKYHTHTKVKLKKNLYEKNLYNININMLRIMYNSNFVKMLIIMCNSNFIKQLGMIYEYTIIYIFDFLFYYIKKLYLFILSNYDHNVIIENVIRYNKFSIKKSIPKKINVYLLNCKKIQEFNIHLKLKKYFFHFNNNNNLILPCFSKRFNKISLVSSFLLYNSNLSKISNYNKSFFYFNSQKIPSNYNYYKQFIEEFIIFDKKKLNKKQIIDFKNFIPTILIKKFGQKKYKLLQLSIAQQKNLLISYSYNKFDNIYSQLENENIKFKFDEYKIYKSIKSENSDKNIDIVSQFAKNVDQKHEFKNPTYIYENFFEKIPFEDNFNYIEEIKKNKERIKYLEETINILFKKKTIFKNFFNNFNNDEILLFFTPFFNSTKYSKYIEFIKDFFKDLNKLLNIFIETKILKLDIFIKLIYPYIHYKFNVLLHYIYGFICKLDEENIIIFAQIKNIRTFIGKKIKINNIFSKKNVSLVLMKIATIYENEKNNYKYGPLQIRSCICIIIVCNICMCFKYVFGIVENSNELCKQTKILNYLILPSYVKEMDILSNHIRFTYSKENTNILINIIKRIFYFVIILIKSIKSLNIKYIIKYSLFSFKYILYSFINLIYNILDQIILYKNIIFISSKGKEIHSIFFNKKINKNKIRIKKDVIYENIISWISNSYFIFDREKKFIIKFITSNKNTFNFNKKLFFKKKKLEQQYGYIYLHNKINHKDIYVDDYKLINKHIVLANHYANFNSIYYCNKYKYNTFPFTLSFIPDKSRNTLVIDSEEKEFTLIKNNLIKDSCFPFVTLTPYYNPQFKQHRRFIYKYEFKHKRYRHKKNVIELDYFNNFTKNYFVQTDLDEHSMLDKLIINNRDEQFSIIFQLELIKTLSPCTIYIPDIQKLCIYKDPLDYIYLGTLINYISSFKEIIFIASTNNIKKVDPILITPDRFNKCLKIKEPDTILKQKKYFFTLLTSRGFYLQNILNKEEINNNKEFANSKGIRDLLTLSNETIAISIIRKNIYIDDNVIKFSRHRQLHIYKNKYEINKSFLLYKIGQAVIQFKLNYSPLNDPLSLNSNVLTKDYFYKNYFNIFTNIKKINLCFYILKCSAGFVVNKIWNQFEEDNLLFLPRYNFHNFNLFYAFLEIEKNILIGTNISELINIHYNLNYVINKKKIKYTQKNWNYFIENECLNNDNINMEEDLNEKLLILNKKKQHKHIKKRIDKNLIYTYIFDDENENLEIKESLKTIIENLNKNKAAIYNNNNYDSCYLFIYETILYMHTLIYKNKILFEKIINMLLEKGWIFPEELKTLLSDFII